MAFRNGRAFGVGGAALTLVVALVVAVLVVTTNTGDDGGSRTDAASVRPPGHATSVPKSEPVPNVKAVPIRSTYETQTRVISRDGGVSVALPDGHDLWIFGDTGVFERIGGVWKPTTFIDGSTALLATSTRAGSVPAGSELPSRVPERFVPIPDDVYLPDGSGRPCTHETAAFPARWPIGAGMLTESDVIVTYSIVCVLNPNGTAQTQAEGWGYMLYNWKTRQIDSGPTDVFEPRTDGAVFATPRIFNSPHVEHGKITLFASQCTKSGVVGCAKGQVWTTTMPATTSALSDPASYKLTPLSTDSSSEWQPLAVSVGRYATGMRMVELTSIVGTYRILTPTRDGRWHLARTGTLPGCPTRTGYCLALEGHPELSTANSTFVSYKDADSGPGGHIVISALPT